MKKSDLHPSLDLSLTKLDSTICHRYLRGSTIYSLKTLSSRFGQAI